MIYRQVRNTTCLMEYAGQRFLLDPVIEEKGEGAIPFRELLDVDAVIVTHLLGTSFGGEGKRLIPRGIKVFVKDGADADVLERDGFSNVEVLTEHTEFQHLGIRKIPVFKNAQGEQILDGERCGVMLSHPVLNSIYLTGESAWYDGMKQVIKTWKPRLIVVSAGFVNGQDGQRLGMNREDLAAVHLTYPRAKIIVTRCPALADPAVSRSDLGCYAKEHRMDQAVLFPEEGQEYRL